ncbi:hypothetical protein [Campylobacter ureolyticus]|uniref:Uncharacterized protein n=1 Tax=Campylobacter ureolyticus TaxID=827 RepID=A0A9Q4KFJ7_9BACT|nr:hypothetical protein [Campylobacter ureolyticus]MCZ6104703.1 hypothetical protein [Campylobacter ureolyticus]MCZ6135309.1 hypothetical protein [Campylobacter ureolyticus]MCZ6157317.1 hypothetical protein [Campylobacter ureolyticus]MCZ6159316.1 hypothetical protein [Campylobacter ureolyticus]MCZ6171215.1 hypothetical protein [Campylobacter ureolyticus]
MLKQRIQGLQVKTVSVKGSKADTGKLQALLAGEVEVYELKGEGGTALPTLPANLNRKTFTVGAKTPTGRRSCYLQIPHVKASANYTTIPATVIGKFDADYDSGIKADFCNMKFDA